jgi:hypothetical protein
MSVVRSEHNWARAMVRRGLAAATMVLALAIYGLATAGTQSLAFKPTASSSSTSGSKLTVSEAVSPTNQSINVATQGPGNTLYFYWNVQGTWYGPYQVGAPGSTFSAPTIVAQANGNFDIMAEGPGHTLYVYWDIAGTWYGPLGAGPAGSVFSAPAVTIETAPDQPFNIDVAAQGPGNTLNTFWETAGDAQWHGPATIDGSFSTYSSPSLSTGYTQTFYTMPTFHLACPCFNNLYLGNEGRFNSLRGHYYDQRNPGWQHTYVDNDGSTFSAPSDSDSQLVYEGVNHSLHVAFGFDKTQYAQIAGGGTTFSAPASGGTANYAAAEGPSNSLYFYVSVNGNGSNCGSAIYCGNNTYQVGLPGTTFSAPALTVESSGTIDFVAMGPGNSLYFWWDIGPGTFYGPVQITGSGGNVVLPPD